MKLLYCKYCGDAKALQHHRVYCECGRVSGNYKADGAHATVSEGALVIALSNPDIRSAAYYADHDRPRIPDPGYRTIRAWMIAPGARVEWEKEKENGDVPESADRT